MAPAAAVHAAKEAQIVTIDYAELLDEHLDLSPQIEQVTFRGVLCCRSADLGGFTVLMHKASAVANYMRVSFYISRRWEPVAWASSALQACQMYCNCGDASCHSRSNLRCALVTQGVVSC